MTTPNLDALAENGLRFTQPYNTARCCLTRASLLTGLYPHQAGVGHMMEDRGHDGYRGGPQRNEQSRGKTSRQSEEPRRAMGRLGDAGECLAVADLALTRIRGAVKRQKRGPVIPFSAACGSQLDT